VKGCRGKTAKYLNLLKGIGLDVMKLCGRWQNAQLEAGMQNSLNRYGFIYTSIVLSCNKKQSLWSLNSPKTGFMGFIFTDL
jgi:hypothetical protein